MIEAVFMRKCCMKWKLRKCWDYLFGIFLNHALGVQGCVASGVIERLHLNNEFDQRSIRCAEIPKRYRIFTGLARGIFLSIFIFAKIMDRRTALKRFALTGAAAMLLPACVQDSKKVSAALESLNVSADDEELLALIAETLIPSTDKPGAREVGAHIFALVMVNNCLPPAKKDAFMTGLRSFNINAPVPGGKEFTEASPDERVEALRQLETKGDLPAGPLNDFYSTARRYIIQGYTTSQYFMTEVKEHKLVPGPVYKGCVALPENLQS